MFSIEKFTLISFKAAHRNMNVRYEDRLCNNIYLFWMCKGKHNRRILRNWILSYIFHIMDTVEIDVKKNYISQCGMTLKWFDVTSWEIILEDNW